MKIEPSACLRRRLRLARIGARTLLLAASLGWAAAAGAQVSVVQWRNDNSRTGQNLEETLLKPSNVKSATFGKLFSQSVDGVVYAQPLVVTDVEIDGVAHDVVYVATENDSVYAFDADTNIGSNSTYLWKTSFLVGPVGTTVTPVPYTDALNCGQITPQIGITGTPVIDPSTNTMWVATFTKEVTGATTNYVHRLHRLDIRTGVETPSGGVIMTATVPGTGDGGSSVTLIPLNYKTRPGLVLLNGIVYVCFSSHCDEGVYHGWILGYNSTTLVQTTVYCTTPNGKEASLWAGGAAPAVSGTYLYINTANGTYDAGGDYGNCFVKLQTTGGLSVVSYFAPWNAQALSNQDLDTGSGGILLLPASAGSTAHPNLVAGAGKGGTIYLCDAGSLGGHGTTSDTGIVVQEISGAIKASFMTPAFYNNTLFFGGSGDNLKAFAISNATINPTPVSSPETFASPGTQPSISGNGTDTTTGIVWSIDSSGILRAFQATNVATELYNSNQNAARDALGQGVKFSVPTVANGKVYCGTQNALVVYGIQPVSLAGTVTLQGCPTAAFPITFTFTPTVSGAAFSLSSTPAANGAFTLSSVPAGEYTLGIKGWSWLRKDVSVNTTAGAVTGVSATLLTGDVNDDNVVDLNDFSLLAAAFGTTPSSPAWNSHADLNDDGVVDLTDFGLLAMNFGLSGDP
jgi:hypothetical protein